jgi:CPA2 family monovalent cation:H+ antiporter-2
VGVPDFLTELVLLIAFAAAGVAVFERFRLPSIAGFLVTGAVVGPGGLGLVSDPEDVRTLAEFGVVFLLFEIALELPVERLWRVWRVSLLAGGVQVSLTVVLVALGAWLLGVAPRPALVLGLLVAMSSTALVMGLLSQRGEIDSPHGQLSIGILLVQDVCIVVFLLLIPLLAGEASPSALPFVAALARATAALAVFFVAARFLLPRLLDRVARLRSHELFSMVAILVVVGAAVSAERVGLTLAVGAFLAGLAVNSTPYRHQLFAELIPLRGVLLGVFFTAVGMLFDLESALAQASGVMLFALAAIPLKAAIVIAVVAFVFRQGLRMGILSGFALAQTGEFSFILAAVAASAGLLDEGLQQVFIAGSVLSLLAAPFLVRVAPEVAARLTRSGGPLDSGAPEARLSGHAVLVGFGLAGRNVARVLRALDIPYLAVEANAAAVRKAQARGENVIYGDATRSVLLQRVGIARARLVAVAITDPTATRQVVNLARSLNPTAAIVARTRYVLDVDRLQAAGANLVVADELESTIDLVSETLRVFGIAEGAIDRFASELRDEGYEMLRAPAAAVLDPWLTELLERVATEWLEVPASFAGEASLADLELRTRTGASVLAVDRGGATSANPPPSFAIRAGDRLLVFGGSEQVARARALLGIGAGQSA